MGGRADRVFSVCDDDDFGPDETVWSRAPTPPDEFDYLEKEPAVRVSVPRLSRPASDTAASSADAPAPARRFSDPGPRWRLPCFGK